ncbi:hypothetical protein [Streptomyces sp. NPDC102283]|uniref:hypothetical protein n=1 Tax=Streptomyces sp. NPDC102283 TaxID=3366155 RepID=UPI003815F6F8
MTARHGRTRGVSVTLALVAASAGLLTGCSNSKEPGQGEKKDVTDSRRSSEVRARQVADAWDGSEAAESWAEGYYPMAGPAEPPEEGFHNRADAQSFEIASFTLRGDLSGTSQKHGKVTWQNGDHLDLPLIGADQAYRALNRGGSRSSSLVITGARLGEMVHATSRGPATVPAWQFTVEGYKTPLKLVAVKASESPESPIKPVGDMSVSELAPLGGIAEVGRSGASLTVLANHGSCDDGPVVRALETEKSVVLSASVTGAEDGPCSSEMNVASVSVKLDRPVDGRIVLDAFTGRPVPYEALNRPAPTP